MRNTNDFQIVIKSSDDKVETISKFDILIKGANGSYCHDNGVLEGVSEISYKPADYNNKQLIYIQCA